MKLAREITLNGFTLPYTTLNITPNTKRNILSDTTPNTTQDTLLDVSNPVIFAVF